MHKLCKKCKTYKHIDKFRICINKKNKKYLKSSCRECENNYSKKYNKDNKDIVNSKRKVNGFLKYKSLWRKKNKERINIREKEKLIANPELKLRKNCSRSISRFLKTKKASFSRYLNYSFADLKEHLEKQFDENMSWDNYGKYWEIDHIIPQSILPYSSFEDKNFKICWSLKNLRPLEKSKNRSDGASRVRHFLYKKSKT